MNTLTRLVLGLLFLGTDIGSVWAEATGAQVPENLVQKTIYVNTQHPQASDSNSGTDSLPLKTISRAATVAVENSRGGIGTKVVIYPGVYRENVEVGSQWTAPIVFEAKEKGKAIISGSEVWTGWQQQGATYTHPWPYHWGLAPYPENWQGMVILQPIVRRREMLFVNGTALDQVLSLQELQAGRFYVAEEEGKVYLAPPTGVDIASATIEVATRTKIFQVHGKTNVVLRGLTFQHDNTPVQGAAVAIFNNSNILIEDCQFRWNNWAGLGINTSQNITVRRSVANYNGGNGMLTGRLKNVLFEDNETSYNNWRGVKGRFTGWSVAGIKNMFIHTGAYRRHRAVGNQTRGFWCDTDCVDVVVDRAVLSENLTNGLFIEASQGPITITHSTLCRNQGDFAGLMINRSMNITLEGNTISSNRSNSTNGESAIRIWSDAAFTVKNWETKQPVVITPKNYVIKNNTVVGLAAKQWLTYIGMPPNLWPGFVSSLASNNNIWFHSENTKVFYTSSGPLKDFLGWQATTGQDANSLFTNPRFVDPASCDFALLPDSPLLKKPFLISPFAPSALITSVQ